MYYAIAVIKSQQKTNPGICVLDSKQNRESTKRYMKYILIMVLLQRSRKRKTTKINGFGIKPFG